MEDFYWQMPPNRLLALQHAKNQRPELVFDAVRLEGINFTFVEVQTLLEGITVGGHRVQDEQIVLNQGKAWKKVFEWVRNEDFELSAKRACALHAIAAFEEALEWGFFRSGIVRIAGTDYLPPPPEALPELFAEMMDIEMTDIYDYAIHVFLSMARCRFFFDVNRRMGRFMMNGILLNAGYPAINLPAKRQAEFNQNMLAFYASGDEKAMNQFMRDCLDPVIIGSMKQAKKNYHQ